MKWYLELAFPFVGPVVVIAIGVWLNRRHTAAIAHDDARLLTLAEQARDRKDTIADLDAIWELPAREATR